MSVATAICVDTSHCCRRTHQISVGGARRYFTLKSPTIAGDRQGVSGPGGTEVEPEPDPLHRCRPGKEGSLSFRPMPVRHRDPTQATVTELFARAFTCAQPECGDLLYLDNPVGPSGRPIRNSRVAHICAQSEGGPRWDEKMCEEDNRSHENLLLLCLKHADQIDQPSLIAIHTVRVLKQWKAGQIREHEELQRGWSLGPDEVREAMSASFTIVAETLSLGGEGGRSPGSGGGGGGAIGSGARGGDGGSGGEIVAATFLASDLPKTVEVTIGAAGIAGILGGDGGDGGDTFFGDLLRARGGRGGKAGTFDEEPLSESQRPTCRAAFFADHASVRDGVINILGAGWQHMDCIQMPLTISGYAVSVVEYPLGASSATYDIDLSVISPSGRRAASHRVTLGRPPTTTGMWYFAWAAEAAEFGSWRVVASIGGDELFALPLEITDPTAPAASV